MINIHTAYELIRRNRHEFINYTFTCLNMRGFFAWMSDSCFLKTYYRLSFGKKLDLKNPLTFNEKLQWLKLYNRKPEYTTMVDKYLVKEYVSNIIGEEYIIPTLGVWDKPEDIEWDILPNKFVLKTTHGGGNTGVVICRNKDTFNKQEAIKRLNESLKMDLYKMWREWPYKNVPRRIIAEKYIDPNPNIDDLPDYKWYCFDGEPKFCQVIKNRNNNETIVFFDTEWNHQEFIGLNPSVKFASEEPIRRTNIEIQKKIARELSKGIPFSRVDLYETGNGTFFGEITFYPASGFGMFQPTQYNEILGQMIKLPGEKWGGVLVKVFDDRIEKITPDLKDYKFFCFNGRIEYFKIDFDRSKNHHANYFNRDLELMHFGEVSCPPDYKKELIIPSNINEMMCLAERVASSINSAFIRIDFYNIDGRIYFGEITFFPAAGFGKFTPEETDLQWGNILSLPSE